VQILRKKKTLSRGKAGRARCFTLDIRWLLVTEESTEGKEEEELEEVLEESFQSSHQATSGITEGGGELIAARDKDRRR